MQPITASADDLEALSPGKLDAILIYVARPRSRTQHVTDVYNPNFQEGHQELAACKCVSTARAMDFTTMQGTYYIWVSKGSQARHKSFTEEYNLYCMGNHGSMDILRRTYLRRICTKRIVLISFSVSLTLPPLGTLTQHKDKHDK